MTKEEALARIKEYRCVDCFHEEKCQIHNKWNIQYGVEGCFYPKTHPDGDLLNHSWFETYSQQGGDLISREAVLNILNENLLSRLAYSINKLPSIQPQKGEWIKETNEYNTWLVCSNCNAHMKVFKSNQYINFCPNCGADMRGEAT